MPSRAGVSSHDPHHKFTAASGCPAMTRTTSLRPWSVLERITEDFFTRDALRPLSAMSIRRVSARVASTSLARRVVPRPLSLEAHQPCAPKPVRSAHATALVFGSDMPQDQRDATRPVCDADGVWGQSEFVARASAYSPSCGPVADQSRPAPKRIALVRKTYASEQATECVPALNPSAILYPVQNIHVCIRAKL